MDMECSKIMIKGDDKEMALKFNTDMECSKIMIEGDNKEMALKLNMDMECSKTISQEIIKKLRQSQKTRHHFLPETKLSARNVNGLHIRLLNLLLWNSDCQHAVLHGGLHLIHLGILRQPEPAEEPPAAPLHAAPPLVLLFLLLVPLSADLEHSAFLDLHLHLLLLQTRQSILVLATAAVSLASSDRGAERAPPVKGKSWNGSHTSRENGSKMLPRRPPKKLLGISEIFLCFANGESGYLEDGFGICSDHFLCFGLNVKGEEGIYMEGEGQFGLQEL
ncbi:hypothetical protein RJ639_039944 [Escallonia herrerae]|uniref:Uncharacterized protein n=1 Tax=Escallonia herrerae TaxID=1293975 RepID=A0AA88WIS8_9ASTE|nr:hypothetical protein RJ639_039944 [Escallonia herrerae]